MNIALVTARVVYTDGQGRVNLELVRHLAQSGHQVTVISSECDVELARQPGVRWLRVPVPASLKPALVREHLFAMAARLVLARAGHFDIVHANGFSLYGASDVNTSHFVHSAHLKTGGARRPGCIASEFVLFRRRDIPLRSVRELDLESSRERAAGLDFQTRQRIVFVR